MGESQETSRILRPRATRVINLSGQKIPSSSFAKIQDVDSDGFAEIIKPDEDSINPALLVITPSSIIPSGAKAVAFPAETGKLYVEHDPSEEEDPVNGDSFGTVEDEWFGQVGKSGFIVLGASGGRAKISPFRQTLLKTGISFWIGTKQGTPPGFSEFTSGLVARLQWTCRITNTGFREFQNSVCDFEGLSNHPTKGFPAPDSFFVVLESAAVGIASLSMLGGVVADTLSCELDLDIITAPIDFSAGSPTFTPIDSLAGVNIKSFPFSTSFQTRNARLGLPVFGRFVGPGHGIETIHGVRISPGSEVMNDNHNTEFRVTNLDAVHIIGL